MFGEFYIDDRLGKDNEVYIFNEIMESMDITEITKSYKKEGGKMHSPKDMISILLYAYSKGITSSYKIAKLIETNIEFIYLAGGLKIARRTICDFRRRNTKGLQKILAFTVKKSIDVGLIKPEGIYSIDGSKFAADASKSKTKTKKEWKDIRNKIHDDVGRFLSELEENDQEEEDIEQENSRKMQEIRNKLRAMKEGKKNPVAPDEDEKEKKIEEAVKRMEKIDKVLVKHPDLKDDERINLTDPESRLMKNGTGEYLQGYNGQIVTSNQMIVAADLFNDENDQDLLVPLVEQLEDTIGKSTKYLLLADAGYNKGENLKWLDSKKNIGPYISMRDRREDSKSSLEKLTGNFAFLYDEDKDRYVCPSGNHLEFFSNRKSDGKNFSIYKGLLSDCAFCPAVRHCLKTKEEQRAGVKIIYDDGTLVHRKEMKDKMSLPESKAIYTQRSVDAEPVFGNIKHNKGIRRFRMKGFEYAKGEFLLISAAANISKIITHIKRQLAT